MSINGGRPRRINNDGKSITELGLAGADVFPGTFVKLEDDLTFNLAPFAKESRKPLYIVNVGDNIGLSYDDQIPVGESATGDYVEQGRQFAALVPAGTVLTKDTELKLATTGGHLVLAGADDVVLAYSQEVYTVPSGPGTPARALVRIRIA